MTVLHAWLKEQTNIKALELAASIVTYAGRRTHLNILKAVGFEPAEVAESIIGDANFAVHRRSLL